VVDWGLVGLKAVQQPGQARPGEARWVVWWGQPWGVIVAAIGAGGQNSGEGEARRGGKAAAAQGLAGRQ